MVYWRSDAAANLVKGMAQRGLLMNYVGGTWVRAVTHLDVSQQDIETALKRMGEVIRACA